MRVSHGMRRLPASVAGIRRALGAGVERPSSKTGAPPDERFGASERRSRAPDGPDSATMERESAAAPWRNWQTQRT